VLFNSYEYLLVFLPSVAAVFFSLNRFASATVAKFCLVAASLAFYSWWGLAYLPLIIISIFVNYGVGTALGTARLAPCNRRALLTAGLGFNLGLLGYFKYANFVVDNANSLAGTNFHLDRIVLPLAISFFTFQKIAYLVDSYRGETVGYNFLNYALFVTFFPQLIAGPIVHHKEVVPQFSEPKNGLLNNANIATGLCILSIGHFKKVMIADTFADGMLIKLSCYADNVST
jgi:alginate O-acetyltransferase complex protein AlgI